MAYHIIKSYYQVNNTSRFYFNFFISFLKLYTQSEYFFRIDKKYDRLSGKEKKKGNVFA